MKKLVVSPAVMALAALAILLTHSDSACDRPASGEVIPTSATDGNVYTVRQPGTPMSVLAPTVEFLDDSESSAKASGSPGRDYAAPEAAAVAGGIIALVGGSWYARRRWLR